MMNKLSLDEIKGTAFATLLHFRRFCEDKGIRYFLSNGTLLGAVKYGGFIPWDDDIDVLLPRADYDRLIADFTDDGRYVLFSRERNPDFAFPFAKLCDMTTRKTENNTDNGCELGLDIDILPIDSWADGRKAAKKQLRRIKRNMFLLNLSKLKEAKDEKPVKRLCKKLAIRTAKAIGAKRFLQRIDRLAKGKGGTEYAGCVVWPIYGGKELMPAQIFGDTVRVSFEGESFPAPAGYDEYLRALYGDYEKDPPADMQKTHHSFEAYKINN